MIVLSIGRSDGVNILAMQLTVYAAAIIAGKARHFSDIDEKSRSCDSVYGATEQQRHSCAGLQ